MPRQRRGCNSRTVTAAVVLYLVVLGISDRRSAEKFVVEAPDRESYYEAVVFGLSDEGARSWSRYSACAGKCEEFERASVASGGKERLEFHRISLEEFIERYPEYRRTPEEDARLDPHLRELIAEQGR